MVAKCQRCAEKKHECVAVSIPMPAACEMLTIKIGSGYRTGAQSKQ